MNHITPRNARRQRLDAGARLIDVAIAADCSPATVRAFEYGAPVRPAILKRLHAAYRRVCAGDTTPSIPPNAA